MLIVKLSVPLQSFKALNYNNRIKVNKFDSTPQG